MNLDGTIHGLKGFTRCLPGSKEKGMILGLGVWEKGEVKYHDTVKQAYDMGMNIG